MERRESITMNMQQEPFTPLVFSSNFDMGHECKKLYSVLDETMATKSKARILHHNFLATTKNLLFTNEIDFAKHMWQSLKELKSRRTKRWK